MQIKQFLKLLGRSDHDQMLGGVCAGAAEVTDTPPWLWRAGMVATALFFFGLSVPIYLVLWLLMPLRSEVD